MDRYAALALSNLRNKCSMVISVVRDNKVIMSFTSFICLTGEQLLELYRLDMESQADKAE